MSTNRVDVILRMRNSREFQQQANKSGKAIRGVGRDADRANRQASRGARGFGMLRRRVDETGRASHRGAGMLRRAAGAAAGLAAAYVGIGSAKRAITTTLGLAKAQLGLSRNFGLSNQRAGEWAAIAKVRGIDDKQLAMGFTALSRNLGQAADGGDKQVAVFKRLGITTRDITRGQKDFHWFLRKTAAGFGDLDGNSRRADAAQKLFGRSAHGIMPLFKEGVKTLDENAAMARKYGAVMGGKPVTEQKNLAAAQRELQFAQLGWQVQFSTRIAPGLIKGYGMIVKASRPLMSAFKWAEDHPKIAKTAVALLAVGVATYKLGKVAKTIKGIDQALGAGGVGGVRRLGRALRGAPGMMKRLFGRAGRAGGDALATNAANTASTQVPRKMSRKRGSFARAGRNVGRTGGIAAGTTLAGEAAGTSASQLPGTMKRRGGKFRSVGRTAGRVFGRAFGIAAAAGAAVALGEALKGPLTKAMNKALGNSLKDRQNWIDKNIPGMKSLRGIDRKLGLGGGATGGLITPHGVRGYARGGLIPRGEQTVIGARFGEFMVREQAVRKVGMPAMHALNEGRVEAVPALAGMGHRTIVVPLHLDRREIGRAVAHDSADQKARS